MRREERESIENFIRDNNIEVLHTLPADTVFASNQYFLDETGLYIQVVDKGVGDSAKKGDIIVVDYYEISMSGDTVYPEETFDAPTFKYDADYTVEAFNTTAKYIKHNGEANLIVPSSLGFESAKMSFTAYRYHVKYKIKG